MDNKIKDMARQAGFVLWEDEDSFWKPDLEVIDWSCSYDSELQKLVELVIKECCQKLEDDGMVEVAMEIKEHFGFKE